MNARNILQSVRRNALMLLALGALVVTGVASTRHSCGQVAGAAAVPDTRPSQLAVMHCSMAKADWLQNPGDVANPYLGGMMASCGNETKKVSFPADDAPLKPVVTAYVKVQQSMAGDNLDAAQLKDFQKATNALDAGKYADLRKLAEQLSGASDLASARTIFKQISMLLIGSL